MVSEDIRARVTSYIRHQAQKPNGELVALIDESQQRLLGVLASADDATSRRAPSGDGEWCLRDLVRHVIDAEDRVARLIVALSRGEQPERRGGGLGSMIDDDGRPWAALLDDLRATNARMLDATRGLPAAAPEGAAKHPFFDELDCREWAAFQRVHDADHIQHAQRILESVRGG